MSGILKNKEGIGAVLVVACMLLCVLSPAIVNWNEEGFFAEDGDEPNFTYVALGDSMVNGFGMADYYPDGLILTVVGIILIIERMPDRRVNIHLWTE